MFLKIHGSLFTRGRAVDPDRHVIYLTEDAAGPFGLYHRWTPPRGFRGERGALAEPASETGGTTLVDCKP